MNESEHKQFVEAFEAQRTTIAVDRVFARKLYTSVPIDTMERTIGEVPYFEKGVVCCALFASPVVLVAGIAFFVLGLRWWALVVAPIAVTLWFANRARSKAASAGIGTITLLLVVALADCFVGLVHNAWVSAGLVSLMLALWCDRLVYVASAHFLRTQVLRNRRALEAYASGLEIRQVG
jgi:energy-converting hydrogenase Eha subunit B